jgi:hypothetical protein
MTSRWVDLTAAATTFEVVPAGVAIDDELTTPGCPALVIRCAEHGVTIRGDLAELTWRLRGALAAAEQLAEEDAEMAAAAERATGPGP